LAKRIGIGCTTYRGHARVENLLTSIRLRNPGVDRLKLDVAIHDDGSPGGIPKSTYLALYKMLDAGFGDITIGGTPDNRGIAPSWNALTDTLIKRGADIVILLNDDILVVDDWVRTMEYFLDNNPSAGSASWGFYWFDPVDVPALLENPDSVTPRTYDARKKDSSGNREHVNRWDAGDATPGRLGAPSGCCFGFTKEKWAEAARFPDHYRSFHEETFFSFKRCEKGHPAFGLTFPFLWHQWSATFQECPELKASETMTRSRKLFCKDFGVPPSMSNHPFDFAHPRVCAVIPAMDITWISKNGVQRGTSPICGCKLCVDFRNSK